MIAAFVLAALTEAANIHEHMPPPDFTFPTAKGTKQLYDLRGKVVVLNFWATWCPPCTDELKDFVRAESAYGKKIEMLTISSEPHLVASSYLMHWDIDLPVIEDLNGSISKMYEVPPIPLTVVIDPSGNVSYISRGELSWPELNSAIEHALATPAVGTPGPGVLR
ncbi:MAG TPA: TlpA disulfide reductase family protein [Candidatus Baltobacteraceae bacterium]|nr:TlpA disulfide reductase family protein [Candidatus Baltobacteraceae bacterium]